MVKTEQTYYCDICKDKIPSLVLEFDNGASLYKQDVFNADTLELCRKCFDAYQVWSMIKKVINS